MNSYTAQTSWLSRLAPYGRFFLRWGWFLALSVIAAMICTFLLPDAASAETYQATLRIQVMLPSGLNGGGNTQLTASFYSSFFVSPGALSLVLAKHKELQITDLEGMVTASSLSNTNAVLLSVIDDTPQHASGLVNDVYNAVVTELHQKRGSVINAVSVALNNELKQTQSAAANSASLLQTLTDEHQAFSSEARQVNSLYQRQLQEIQSINQQLLTLQQEESGNADILHLSSATPDITTLPPGAPTQGQRMALSPLIGIIMGLGGILLASTFSNKVPLRGKKRETVLPWVNSTVPLLSDLRDHRLQVLKNASPCLSLFRHLRYQSSEHGKPLHLITVTSPKGHEGKSVVAVALALAAAQNGLRTLLVDANPQRPVLHTWFRIPNSLGMLDAAQLLYAGAGGPSPILRTAETNLGIIPIGNKRPTAGDFTETIQVDVLRPFIKILRHQADLVVFDGPPLLSDANATNLAQLSDVTVLVIDAQKSQSTAVIEAKNLLSTIEVSSATILNRAGPEAIE